MDKRSAGLYHTTGQDKLAKQWSEIKCHVKYERLKPHVIKSAHVIIKSAYPHHYLRKSARERKRPIFIKIYLIPDFFSKPR